MKIGILGDTHQNNGALRFALWTFRQLGIDVIYQVGDYGVGADRRGIEFQKRVSKNLDAFGQTLFVVPGNHENWDRITGILEGVTKNNRTQWGILGGRTFLAPRGIRWKIGDMSFVALGGAPSVDRMYRVSLMKGNWQSFGDAPWYPGEQITREDVDYVTAGGYADVMLAHDAPHGVQEIERRIGGNPHGFHPADILYAEDGRQLMTEAFRGVAPKLFFHGHYHFKVDEHIQRPGGEYGVDTTHVIGLDCEYHNWSMAVLDTETGDAQHIDHVGHLFRYQKEFG